MAGISIDEYNEYPITGSSLTALYDNIIYWELAKNNNQFFVTFEKGLYGIPNNKQESIGTMEITYPHVNSNTGSSNSFISSSKRVGGRSDAFLQEEEKSEGIGHRYNGFIPITELKGSRYFQTTITSSLFNLRTYNYEISGSNGLVTTTRTVSASYFYPFSSHQLSVLRKDSSLILDLDADNELPEGIGQDGYIILPENLHENIKNNLESYLEAASNAINL
tara:strand:+ start:1355 stop:2017 length:663 start_codon:yes stop_codon:yes gene_type:complete